MPAGILAQALAGGKGRRLVHALALRPALAIALFPACIACSRTTVLVFLAYTCCETGSLALVKRQSANHL